MARVNYSSAEFEEKFTYTGADLGANWTAGKTVFRLWAPTATAARVNLYRSGTPGADDRIGQVEMNADERGTWLGEQEGDLNGIYYTYEVTVDGKPREACDPYARTTGVNGQRAMVIDLRSTDPEGWELDQDPHAGSPITDAVIWELHIRDLSSDPGSGITHKGKFLGVIEQGTVNSQGIPTGLDHMKALGITHVQLLPCFDYGSVDERHPEGQFNWGYDPMNFNVPEGSYATDPDHGAVRVAEMKRMVKGLHDSGISVVMDVVYNHVYEAESFCLNRIVPGYFSRIDRKGIYSNGSCCGNDTATERSMVRKYIVDSVKYWASEYHIDGFRFDLAGLMDAETINEVVRQVHQEHPNVIFYGEGWDMPTALTKPGAALAIQANSALTPGFGYFSDTIRDLIKGSVFFDDAPGYVSGAQGQEAMLQKCFLGLPDWCADPAQSINYVSCHDNMTLFDRLIVSTPEETSGDHVRMNKLAAVIYMTSQGVPFLQAGEEMLRSKKRTDGTFDGNSYRSPDSINSIKWDDLNDSVHRAVLDYYRGLIAFRKAHSALRMTSAEQIRRRIRSVEDLEPNVAAFHILGAEEELFAVFNPNRGATEVPLPDGSWASCIDANRAGTEPIAIYHGSASVEPISALILVKKA